MAKKAKRGRKKKQNFESAGVLVWGRTPVQRRPAAARTLSPSRRGALLALLAVLTAATMWLIIDDRFYVSHVDVVGAVRVSPDEIYEASGLSGLHILWAHPVGVENRILNSLPTIGSAQVKCRIPADCAIVVVERQPRVVWDEGGLLWWIDEEGVIFNAQGALLDGWLVRGPLPRSEDGRLDERVRIALTELWSTGQDVASEFEYVPAQGLVFIDERGWLVVLGQGPGMVKRLQVLERMTSDLEARSLVPKFIDVRFADAPYYSLTNDW
ncbi:MAG: FtsQ-type POTRA domain-containing protein [Chloroflexi bacterium]|nr:FtsQ-type POTRA domain-containing protein [Chloroflexota bacterium]